MKYVKKEAVEALLQDAENGYVCLDKLLHQLNEIERVSIQRINNVADISNAVDSVIQNCTNGEYDRWVDDAYKNRSKDKWEWIDDNNKDRGGYVLYDNYPKVAKPYYVEYGCNCTQFEQMTKEAKSPIGRKTIGRYIAMAERIGYKRRGKGFTKSTPLNITELSRFLHRLQRDQE